MSFFSLNLDILLPFVSKIPNLVRNSIDAIESFKDIEDCSLEIQKIIK